MWDKTFLMLFILFLAVGVTTYDRYVVQRGEISPVGRLLDFAGIAKTDEGPQTKIKRDSDIYRFSLEENIARLRSKHLEIQQKRDEYIQRRYVVFDQLTGLNGEMNKETLKYVDVINKEREGFLAHFPGLSRIGAEMDQAARQNNQIMEHEKYQTMKEDIHGLLARISVQPQDDFPNVYKAMARMDGIVDHREDVLAQDCPQGPTACLTENMEALNKEVRQIVESSVDQPPRDVQALLELVRQLAKEYDILEGNFKGSELELSETEDQIMDLFQGLLRDVVKVSDEDIIKMEALYNKLQGQQKVLLDNIDLNRQRVEEVHVQMDQKIQDIDKHWIPLDLDQDAFPRELKQTRDQRMRLMQDFQDNELQVRQLMKEQWARDEEVINVLTESVDEDLKKLKEDREYAQRQYENSIRGKLDRLQGKTGSVASNGSGAETMDRLNQQQKQSTSIDQHMQKLRDKARDQGF